MLSKTDPRLRRTLRSARAADYSKLVRRFLGLPYLTVEDFLPPISGDQAARLSRLSLNARGPGPAPILVLGIMPRCGSNFLRDLIALHPDTYPDPWNLYEFPLLGTVDAARAWADDFIVRFPRNEEQFGELDMLAMLGGAWLRELQREAGDKPILLKSPHVHALGLAPYLFAGARIVICLRDGRDVIDSTINTFSRYSPGRKTFGQLSREWRCGAEAIASFLPGGENEHPDVLVVRYEDVLDDTDARMREVLQHSGLDPERYDFAAAASLPGRGSSRNKSTDEERWKPQERAVNFKPIRRWEKWSSSRKEQFLRIAGASLQAAGYDR